MTECTFLIAKFIMVGSMVSTSPNKSLAVFQYPGEFRTHLVREGVQLDKEIFLLEIKQRRTAVFMCQGEKVEYRFHQTPREEPAEPIVPEQEEEMDPWHPPEEDSNNTRRAEH